MSKVRSFGQRLFDSGARIFGADGVQTCRIDNITQHQYGSRRARHQQGFGNIFHDGPVIDIRSLMLLAREALYTLFMCVNFQHTVSYVS